MEFYLGYPFVLESSQLMQWLIGVYDGYVMLSSNSSMHLSNPYKLQQLIEGARELTVYIFGIVVRK